MHELCAFGILPRHQGLGLGARVLEALEWLLGDEEALELARGGCGMDAAGAGTGLELSNGGRVYGVDVDEMRRGRGAGLQEKRAEEEVVDGRPRQSKIVLVAVREIGNEEYYKRRGYKSIGTGVLPVGTWGSKVECTSVLMEKGV